MKTVFLIAYIAHMLAIAGILGLLLHQWNKSPRKLSKGVMHSAATALLAGLVMVGTYSSAKPDETLDHTKVGIKLLVVLAILVLSYINAKKSELKKSIWLTLIGLTVLNILIATVG
ncbi:hypothetical protein A1sIIB106_06340 [Candidatus Planktophila lacus]|uniref:hypothetical protein n=1 Tax=Candidatus Planktophila lacus TaxID=1884913 RepID=UPI000BACAA0E|nr:hypothetical protein [Candidatus Planktophila lacus]ASY25598.1 hypothetical protein A1sIIB106_06340 [Candidatus Planktophila lacus]